MGELQNDGHAFLTGQILAMLNREPGWSVQPVMDGDKYSNQIVVNHPQIRGNYVIEVKPAKDALGK